MYFKLAAYLSPRVEVHAGQFTIVGFGNVNVERLTLVNVGSAFGSHLDDHLLRDFPHGPVQLLDVVGNAINIL